MATRPVIDPTTGERIESGPPQIDPVTGERVSAQPQYDYSSLTHNPHGEGTYQIKAPDGQTIEVPYSNVPVFTGGLRGSSFASPDEEARFNKDAAADPKRPTFWNALTNPVGSGGREQGQVGAGLQMGGQAIKAMVQPFQHPIDAVKGTSKLLADVAAHGPQAVGDDVVGPMVEKYMQDKEQGGHALALENLLGTLLGQTEGARLGGVATRPLVGGALRYAGAGLQNAGEGLAESALGVRNVDRAFEANPGRAALTETTGFKPSTIAGQAQDRLEDLRLERAAAAQANPGPVDFSPARRVASDAMQEQALRNAIPQIDRMAPLAEQIRTQGEPRGGWPIGVTPPRAAGRPIPPYVETPEALNLREGVGDYAADKPWTGKASADPLRGMVRGVYGSMSDAIHTAVPEIAPLDAQMHDLIPVAQRASEIDLNANMLQRAFGRFARPTGALAGTISGAAGGHMIGGGPGALLGGAAGLLAPELLASPAFQMGLARTLHGAGLRLVEAAPAAGAGAAGAVMGAEANPQKEPEVDPHTGPNGQPNYYSDDFLRAKAEFDARAAEIDKKQK